MEMDEPRRDMHRPKLDANGSHVRDGPPRRAFLYEAENAFDDDARGDARFQNHRREYEKLMNGKKKLVSMLLTSVDREVLDAF